MTQEEIETVPDAEKAVYVWPEWFTQKDWSQYKSDARTWAFLFQQLPTPIGDELAAVVDKAAK